MTKGPAPSSSYEHRSFGAPGAQRTVILLREGVSALSDPRPDVTARRDVRIVAVGLTMDDIDDPAAYRGTTPAEATAVAIAQFIAEEQPGHPVGLVGHGEAGELAILIAAQLGANVDRLALLAVPRPESELGGSEVGQVLARIAAKTLIMNAQADPTAALAAARWFKDRMASARIEMVPRTTDPETRLVLAGVWERVLSHVAPSTIR
jgi:pimeloyl-ACP methyl ester carboxylesterase